MIYYVIRTLRGGDVGVGRGDGQDDAVGVLDVLEAEVADLQLDVLGLVADGHLRDARQVDQREREHLRRVHLQDDRVGGHVLHSQ